MSEQLDALPMWFLLTWLSILGAIWGSFVAALCSRWPSGDTIMAGRSRCDKCGVQIASFDLVPLISYMILGGKCRSCTQAIGVKPFAIELVAALVGAVSVLLLPADQAIAAAIFGWLLLPLIILDFEHLWLPDRLVLVLCVTGLIIAPLLEPQITLASRAIGAAAGFLLLEIIRQGYRLYRKQDGMGAGDPKLFGALGIWLGWEALPLLLLTASLIGIAVAIFHAFGRKAQTAFPFGSYLGIAAYLIAVSG